MTPSRREDQDPQTRRDPRPHRRARPFSPGLQNRPRRTLLLPHQRGSLTAAQLPATTALSAARAPMTQCGPAPASREGRGVWVGLEEVRTCAPGATSQPGKGAPSTQLSGRNLSRGQGGTSGGGLGPLVRADGETFSYQMWECVYAPQAVKKKCSSFSPVISEDDRNYHFRFPGEAASNVSQGPLGRQVWRDGPF